MTLVTFDELREEMNALGRAGAPFVWGVDYDCRRGFILRQPFAPSEIMWEIHGRGNAPRSTAARPAPQLRIKQAVDYHRYAEMFATLRGGLLRGDSFLANLTAPTEVECTAGLYDVFRHSSAPFKLLIADEFVCFSPEPFVTIDNGRISTFPMKGTIDATLPDAERRLMEDYKETCEHFTIVDLMRNDLNMVAEDVSVARLRYVESIATASGSILQTSSEITGQIPHDKRFDFGDIILPLLPAGSITGAPKRATVNLIARSEIAPREWYTGVFGYFDGRVMQSAVMIRCLQHGADGRLYFHSGGGVTVNSHCREEYDELLTKVYLTK
nr:aminodeoxychorismate synthase component I [Bacteroides sp.]